MPVWDCLPSPEINWLIATVDLLLRHYGIYISSVTGILISTRTVVVIRCYCHWRAQIVPRVNPRLTHPHPIWECHFGGLTKPLQFISRDNWVITGSALVIQQAQTITLAINKSMQTLKMLITGNRSRGNGLYTYRRWGGWKNGRHFWWDYAFIMHGLLSVRCIGCGKLLWVVSLCGWWRPT